MHVGSGWAWLVAAGEVGNHCGVIVGTGAL